VIGLVPLELNATGRLVRAIWLVFWEEEASSTSGLPAWLERSNPYLFLREPVRHAVIMPFEIDVITDADAPDAPFREHKAPPARVSDAAGRDPRSITGE
jgi:hypothetical protein